MLSYQNCNTS